METLACLVIGLCGVATAAERPNIVVVMCDDLGYADVGFNGSPDITTPHLDELAHGGTVFTAAYVAHPFCGPSRMGMMSGRYPHTFGAPFNLPNSGLGIVAYNRLGIPKSETLISTVLQRAGYFTGAIGKWHMGIDPQYHPNNRGFDDFYGFLGGGHSYFPDHFRPIYQRQIKTKKPFINDYVSPLEHNGHTVDETEYITDGLSREASRFVQQAAETDKPFFLYLAYNAPHSPLEAKPEDMARFKSINDKKRKTYAGMVYAVDRGVGRLVQSLKTTGQYENTLIVFLSDNGGKLGLGANNTPLKKGKGSTFEGGFRVPMFFHWPGHIPADNRVDHPVTALDFYPTFAGLAGATIPETVNLAGKDIWDAIQSGDSPRQGEMIYAVRHRDGFSDVGARRDKWKITREFQSPWMLFNIDEDISESRDLSADHPELLRSMVSQVETWSRDHTTPLWYDNLEAQTRWQADEMPQYETTFTVD